VTARGKSSATADSAVTARGKSSATADSAVTSHGKSSATADSAVTSHGKSSATADSAVTARGKAAQNRRHSANDNDSIDSSKLSASKDISRDKRPVTTQKSTTSSTSELSKCRKLEPAQMTASGQLYLCLFYVK